MDNEMIETKGRRSQDEWARGELISAFRAAWYCVADDFDLSEGEKQARWDALERQAQRVEKLFGYEPGSGGRW